MTGLIGIIYIHNLCRKSALKAIKSAVHVAGGRHEQLFRDDALAQNVNKNSTVYLHCCILYMTIFKAKFIGTSPWQRIF